MPHKTFFNIKTQKMIVYALLIFATLAVYAQVREFNFVNFDDQAYVTENQHIQKPSWKNFLWAFSPKDKDNVEIWSPLIWVSLMLDFELFGLQAGGYHLTNVLWHLLATLLLFALLFRMTQALWRCAFVAAFFALHPLHVESVAWISERKDVLSAFFWMLTLYAYVRYTEKPSLKTYLPVFVAFLAALMSKPMAVTLPLILMLLDVWPLNRWSLKKETLILQLKEKLPLLMLSGIITLVSIFGRDYPSMKPLPLMERITNAPLALTAYLAKTFWPQNLAVFYPFPLSFPLWKPAGALLIIAALTVAVIFRAKRSPYFFTGWLWFLISITPVLGIIQVGRSTYAMTDRYHYLPSVGLAIILAWGIPSFFKSDFLRKSALPMGILFLAIMSMIAWKQCGYWKDSFSLFQHALAVTENNSVAYNLLGVSYYKDGYYEQAVQHYTEAIHKYPNEADGYYFSRAKAFCGLGQYQQAISDYHQAIRLNPDNSDVIYNDLGFVYYKLGQLTKAVDYFTEAIRLNKDFTAAYKNRGTVYNELGQHQKALADFSLAIILQKDDSESYEKRGSLYVQLGRYSEAMKDFSAVIRLRPDDYAGYFNRANALIRLGEFSKALEDLNQAAARNANDPAVYNNRGFLHLQAGRLREALEDFTQTVRLNPNDAGARNNRAFVLLSLGDAAGGCAEANQACTLGECATLQIAREKSLCGR